MNYTCPVCQENIVGDVVTYKEHSDNHIIDLLKYDHPEWVEKDGTCKKCYAYYKAEIDGSIFKDAPCAKRIRLVKKIFRPVKMLFVRAKRNRHIIVFVFLLTQILSGPNRVQSSSDPIIYTNHDQQASLMELFVSEGCSSCPPAQKWVSQYIDNPNLWKTIVPVVFHVDYWDYLGWKDPFSSSEHTQRQYQYKQNGHVNSVYTPGFVVDGKEWRGWFQKKILPKGSTEEGHLSAHLKSGQLDVTYGGKIDEPILNIAILGFGIQIDIKSGENRNRTLTEDFVVLKHDHYLSQNGRWSLPIPIKSVRHAKRYAVALWINSKGDLTPLQAIGGWLN